MINQSTGRRGFPRTGLVFGALLLAFNAGAGASEKSEWKRIKRQYQKDFATTVHSERAKALNVFRGVDSDKSAKILVKQLLTDSAYIVAEAAADILATYESEKAIKKICGGMKKRPKVKEDRYLLLLRTIGRIRKTAVFETLLKHAKKKEPAFILISLEGLGRLRHPDPKALEVLAKYADAKQDFPLRMAAVRALAEMPDQKAVALLVEAAKTPGRIQEVATRGLILLTGQTFGLDPAAWAAWWQKNAAGFKLDAEAVKAKRYAEIKLPGEVNEDFYEFFEIELYAKRVLFIIDRSGSMGAGTYPRRIDGVKRELLRLIDSLDESVSFNIVFFSNAFAPWQGAKLHPAKTKIKEQMKAYIKGISPKGPTHTDKVMERILRQFKGANYVETIFLLTDGAPFRGDYLDMDEVRKVIREANRNRYVRINTIGCFTGNQQADSREPPREKLIEFLQNIARDNNGSFKELVGNN